MNFKDLDNKLSHSYDSDKDDILNAFYMPVLKRSKKYYRMVGFFSSNIFPVAAKGIQGLLENDGEMKLIAGVIPSRKDLETIKEAEENPEKVINDIISKNITERNDEFYKDHLSVLGWMVANKKLFVRIAIVTEKKNNPIIETDDRIPYFHLKVGICEDNENNMLSFSGSENETAQGWQDHIEEFKVYRNWNKDERKYFQDDLDKFNRFWNNKAERTIVVDIPKAINDKLIDNAAKSYNDAIKRIKKWVKPHLKTDEQKLSITPWPHQSRAVNHFKNNSYKGILKMATGTGKTYNALFCLDDYFNNIQKYFNRILIIVPEKELARQWKKDLANYISKDDLIFSFHSDIKTEQKRNALKMWKRNFKIDQGSNIYLIITVDSIKNFTSLNKRFPDIVIGDEVHSYGTEKRVRILKKTFENTKYFLGLSATPERYYDSEGTKEIINLFGKIIYTYNIKDAQREGILADYFYYPSIVKLTAEEENEVKDITAKIAKKMAIKTRDILSEKTEKLPKDVKKLLIKRSRLIKTTSSKLDALKEILKEHDARLKQCIVYCEDTNQLEAVQKVFDTLKIESYINYHSKMITRDAALKLFKNQSCRYILSMHCLDQGVNIPACESLILMSSSTNPREYVQRRGRVLRNPQNIKKPSVKIFDILSFPNEIFEGYRGIVLAQIIRAWEFINCSQSPEAKIKFHEIKEQYKISNNELDIIIEEWTK